MKISFVPTIIAIGVSLLIAYGFYSFHDDENQILLTIGSFVFLAVTMALSIGVNFSETRTTTNIRAISGIFFVLAFISNFIFSAINFAVSNYIITNGILLLVFILIVYSINKSKQ